MELQAAVIVGRAIGEVFALWADAERYPEWFEMSLERRKLTDGPMQVGSKYTAIDKMPLRRRFESTLEITAFDPNQRIAATLSPPTNASWEATFEESDGGTKMTFTTVANLSRVQSLLAPVLKRWANRQLQDGLTKSKAAAESA